jgi:glutamate--cysteine ligase
MFFVVRDGSYFPSPGVSFREFLREGWRGHRARLRDFATHLTTLFPEVRLKRVIELRGADAQPAALSCAVPALWKGLLYDAQAAEAALALVADWGSAEREEALRQAARSGLAGRVGGRKLLDLARELVAIGSAGLDRLAGAAGDDDERRFLDPVWAQLELGKSPGEVVLERWEGEWGRSLPRLIEYARY